MAALMEKIATLKRKQNINVFLCGLRGSGKTTLLYKSLITNWQTICNEIEPTTLFHYENLRFDRTEYGIWDFSGDMQVTAVVFLINAMDESEMSRNEIMDRIQTMQRDDAFRASLFFILFNTISMEVDATGMEKYIRSNLSGKENVLFFSFNASLGLHDPAWVKTLQLIHLHHKKNAH
ncbi:hypothetical protein BgAZ_102340 [Babesia gibsoni]|uniref:ADP-ribosylation factor n=1 Tax=Babesia gibsoni TaxID=33632 RepID=A0AAD8UV06_BABGI|nr:hypothetical protein BgAZ_102340 [Babesia gibsoni]